MSRSDLSVGQKIDEAASFEELAKAIDSSFIDHLKTEEVREKLREKWGETPLVRDYLADMEKDPGNAVMHTGNFRQRLREILRPEEKNPTDSVETATVSDSMETHFLKSIEENPSDLGLVHIFGDWLEDQGDPRSEIARDVSLAKRIVQLCTDYSFQATYLKRLQTEFPALSLPDPPTLEKVWRTFSVEQWKTLEHLQDPILILIPPVDFSACVALLNGHRSTSRDFPSYINWLYDTNQHPKPAQWQAFFIEGKHQMPARAGESLNDTLANRLRNENQRRPKHARGMDRYLYVWLLVQWLERGLSRSRATWTPLNADNAVQDYHFPGVTFDTIHLIALFIWNRANDTYDGCRFRMAVGGDAVG